MYNQWSPEKSVAEVVACKSGAVRTFVCNDTGVSGTLLFQDPPSTSYLYINLKVPVRKLGGISH